MELIKSSCKLAAVFLLFLLLLLLMMLPPCCLSRGLPKMDPEEVYVIDYRGPETHSYIPPPNGSGGREPHIHHRNVVVLHRKSKAPTAAKGGPAKGNNHG